MRPTTNITFGDKVRLLSTPETEALGVAGHVGQVLGETTPSVTSVTVVGQLVGDYALSVLIDGQSDTLWFAPELLEFVGHAAGTEVRFDGIPKKWIRSESGDWIESTEKKPWWKFW